MYNVIGFYFVMFFAFCFNFTTIAIMWFFRFMQYAYRKYILYCRIFTFYAYFIWHQWTIKSIAFAKYFRNPNSNELVSAIKLQPNWMLCRCCYYFPKSFGLFCGLWYFHIIFLWYVVGLHLYELWNVLDTFVLPNRNLFRHFEHRNERKVESLVFTIPLCDRYYFTFSRTNIVHTDY